MWFGIIAITTTIKPAIHRAMKKISVKIHDQTHAELTEEVTVDHLSELSDGVKEVMDDFVEQNEGVVLPPVEIKAVEGELIESKSTGA